MEQKLFRNMYAIKNSTVLNKKLNLMDFIPAQFGQAGGTTFTQKSIIDCQHYQSDCYLIIHLL